MSEPPKPLTIEQITERVSEKLRPQLFEEISKAIKENLAQNVTVSEPAEIHDLSTWDPYCPNCHMPNEKFTGPAKWRCKGCKRPLGNDEDIAGMNTCKYCKSSDTVEKNEGYVE